MIRSQDALIVAVILFVLGLVMGGWFIGTLKSSQIAAIERAHAESVAETEKAARLRLEAAQARGDELSTRLATSEKSLKTLSEETAHEIKRLTTGRLCLDADVVSLLNKSNTGNQPVPLPKTSSQPDAASGSAATDTDIAYWIGIAGEQHNICRARLQALIDWHNGEQ